MTADAYGPPIHVENTTVGMVEMESKLVDQDEVTRIVEACKASAVRRSDHDTISISWGDPSHPDPLPDPTNPGDPVTPTDTNPSGVHTSNTPSDPCVCGHSRRNHGKEDGRAVCFVCTHPAGGCRGGFTPDRPESTAAEYDAFLAGFAGGIGYGSSADEQGLLRWEDAATLAYREWVEGPGEDA